MPRSREIGRSKSLLRVLVGVSYVLTGAHVVFATDPPANEQQLQRLMETAAQAPDRPDHDFAANSLRHLVAQAKDLNLTQEQMTKINEIVVHYNQIRNRQEATYKQSEMEALKLIHDNHSSLTAIEGAVQKSDQEHSKLRMAGIKAVREATDVLRPEQYANWRQNHASRQLAAGKHDGEPATSAEKDRVAPH